MPDNVIELAVDVDEINLSLRGWTVTDSRARMLLSEYGDGPGDRAKVTITCRARHSLDGWTDRFTPEDWLPPLIAEVSIPSLTGVSSIKRIFVSGRSAKRGALVTIEPDWLGTPASWVPPGDLQVTITSYDHDELNAGQDLGLLRPVVCPIEVIDETSEGRPYKVFDVTAQLLEPLSPDENELRIRIHGFLTLDGQKVPVEIGDDYGDLYPPELSIEVFDETGFPTEVIPVDSTAGPVRSNDVPGRAGRWITEIEVDGYVPPAKIIVRIIDNEEDDWEPYGDDDW